MSQTGSRQDFQDRDYKNVGRLMAAVFLRGLYTH